jgi:5-methylcytosine-specific restriction endonuclease McrA
MSPRLPSTAPMSIKRPAPALCPLCGTRTRVIDSDPEGTGRRYRRCRNPTCDYARKPYRTSERIDHI